MKILVVERHGAAEMMERSLAAAGHTIYVAATTKDACNLAILYDYDAIVMSLDFDDLGGAQAIRALRARKVTTPLIALGDSRVEPRIEALAAGADHVMAKPLHEGELLARLDVAVRRARGYVKSILHIGPIELNLTTREVEVGGRRLDLTPDEYKMLELFALRRNTPLALEQCLSHLPNGRDPAAVGALVGKLRDKIAAANGGDPQIESIWGSYYVLRDAPRECVAA